MRSTGAVSLALALVAVAFSASSARAMITFRAGVPIDLSDDPPSDGVQAIAVADLNHDGKADLIVVHQATGDISVFLSSGSGSFNTPTLSSDHSPIAVTTGDFDNDGNVDMAVVNDDDTVTTYLGDGAGNFTGPGNNYDVCGDDSGAVGVVAARLNDDLYDDLAVLCDGTVHLLRSVGDGTFSPFGTPSVSTLGYGNFAIAAGRINNSHNYVDLAISSADTDSVTVLFGNNDGTFQSPFVIQSGLSNPQGLAIGNFYGDSNPDIAVISGIDTETTVDILKGNGAGGFMVHDTKSTSSAEIGSVAIVALDLDGDGKTDLAVGSVEESGGLVQLFCQQPSTVCLDTSDHANPTAANFQIQGIMRALSGSVSALQSGDLNGDGKPDLVGVQADTGAIKILFNTTGEPTPTPTPIPTPTPAVRINVGSARGGPGDTVTIAVSLRASSIDVAATANDISFDPSVLSLDPSDCEVNPMIDKSLVASVVWEGAYTKTVRVFIRSNPDAAPIPDGILYTCTVGIALSAWPGSYPLWNWNSGAFGPGAQSLWTVGAGGLVTVSLVPLTCVGDCSADGSVTVGDILEMVDVALGNRPTEVCQAGDADGDGAISVDEILTAVNNALNGCP